MKAQSQVATANAPGGQSASQRQHGLLQRQCACGEHTGSGEECENCKSRRKNLQRFSSRTEAPDAVPPVVNEVLRGSGRPLDAPTRDFMESRFGEDFSMVRLHTGPLAAESARSVNARAWTFGRDIVFGTEGDSLQSPQGQRLLAHELTHVVQQRGSSSSLAPAGIGESGGALELEAQRTADAVMSNRSSRNPAVPALAMAFIQRAEADGGSAKTDAGAGAGGGQPAKPSCGPVDLFTELDMPWPIPNSYFHGSMPVEKDGWKKDLDANSKGKCVSKGSFKDVKLAWDLGNPRLGSYWGKNLNKNDVTFDLNVIALYAGQPCCSCFSGNASWSFDVEITRGKESGKTASPIKGGRTGEACKGDQCCTVSQDMNVGVSSGISDITATFTGNVKLNGSTYGQSGARHAEADQGGSGGTASKKGGLGTGAWVAIGSVLGAASLVGGYFGGKALHWWK